MNKLKLDFRYSNDPEPHKERTKAILKAHPEVRTFIGRYPVSFLLIMFVVGLQIVIAYLLKDQGWWPVSYHSFCSRGFCQPRVFCTDSRSST